MDIWLPVLFEVLKGVVLFVGTTLSSTFLFMGIWILRNPDEVKANNEALSMYRSGCPLTQMPFDYRSRINPGIAVNKKNQWVLVGELTDYAFTTPRRRR